VARIDASARIADGARLGADVEIGPYSVIGADVEVGDGCRIGAHVHIGGVTRIGARTTIHPFAVLGSPPQSVHYRGGPTRLVIGADCIVREHVTMNTGTEDGNMETRVGDKCFLMTGAHVAHDCRLGNEVTLVNNVLLAGHCQIDDFAVVSGASAMHQHVRVGAHAFLGGLTGLTKDLLPFCMAFETPAVYRGINLVGLRRRGFSRADIQTIRRALRALFEDTGPVAERVERLDAAFAGDANVKRIVDFIRAGRQRPFLLPEAKRPRDEAEGEP
jgi:UDP-N-acetylglucosamine acyltransferase